jgi:hypothetical protein
LLHDAQVKQPLQKKYNNQYVICQFFNFIYLQKNKVFKCSNLLLNIVTQSRKRLRSNKKHIATNFTAFSLLFVINQEKSESCWCYALPGNLKAVY